MQQQKPVPSPTSLNDVHLNKSSQFSSVATLCNYMDCSMPGFPVHHQLLELAQTHIHRVSDAIQPSHLLFSPPPAAFNLSQHQSLSQWVSSSHQVAKGLGLQHQSFQWVFRTSFRIDWFDLLEIRGTLWKGKKQVMVHISCCQRRTDDSSLCCKMIQCTLRSTMRMTAGVCCLQ